MSVRRARVTDVGWELKVLYVIGWFDVGERPVQHPGSLHW